MTDETKTRLLFVQKIAVSCRWGFTQGSRELANVFFYKVLDGCYGYGTRTGNGSLLAPSTALSTLSLRRRSGFDTRFEIRKDIYRNFPSSRGGLGEVKNFKSSTTSLFWKGLGFLVPAHTFQLPLTRNFRREYR